MMKKAALSVIDQKADIFTEVSDKIWEYAELSLMEYKSMDLYLKVLEEEGFTVEKGICGVPTAFSGSFGSGRPIIGILGEFDALSGLSQVAGITERKQLVEGGCGHGCGHNMLGAGSLAAAFAVKRYLEETKKSGTVIFYGCPGEEGGAGKAFMERDNAWRNLDAAISWHPGDSNGVSATSNLSCIQKEYKFTGLASHAAGAPEFGRSALDAVELMNIGVQFLREHMPSSARIHYAITDGGGNSPNVVQPTAQVLYMVRAVNVNEALKLQARVDKIAEAAAMMTETEMKIRFIDGTADVLNNVTLEQLLYKNFEEIGVAQFDEEDFAYATELAKTYTKTRLPGTGEGNDDKIMDLVIEKTQNGTRPLNDFLIPYYPSGITRPGSTDVGDVSWQTPTAQIRTVCFAAGSPGHSWQNVCTAKSSIGHKGLLNAGKVMAAAVIDMIDDPTIIEKATEEFKKKSAAGYNCPIPADAVPTPVGGTF
ncbi:MAG: amidohydrolase [Clostridia bacterium]|nr:amidohydrolase [Clostridia bacterium]